ncbi:MAG: hypothetical protein JWL69_207 [Phycisphaerales bacterium]|nr:hypothetical protein [Phycisphaerales bacterium]
MTTPVKVYALGRFIDRLVVLRVNFGVNVSLASRTDEDPTIVTKPNELDEANKPGLPQGYSDVPEEDRKKAQVFFQQGATVAGTGNYEYAIEMYVQGLALDPEEIDAHKALREISLKRKVSGGKDMGMFEKRKYRTSTKEDKTNMLNAEMLLAYDPGNRDHMVVLLQSAHRAGYYDTALWIAAILLRANLDATKPDYNKFIILKDVYKALSEYKLATDACYAALKLRPNDMDLTGEMKNLAAMQTLTDGKYLRAKSFRESMRNKDSQDQLLEGEKDVRSTDFLTRKIMETEAEWRGSMDDRTKFTKYIEALKTTETLEHENHAIELLEDFFRRTKEFKWRQKAGEIKISQLNRMQRTLAASVKLDPNDVELKKEYQAFMVDKVKAELDEYKMIVENYPTDTGARFEMAGRMFQLRQFQDAIPIFQHVRNDPKFRSKAGTLLARCFLEAGFLDEASDTFKVVIEEYPGRGDETSKDMVYWYGRTLEQLNDMPTAIKQYSQVAQMDFNFRDVQERIKRLRSAAAAPK